MSGKLRLKMLALPLMALVVVYVGTGCSKKPTDAALATEVQKTIMADSSLTAQPISVAANDGIVTLSGTVGDQTMRNAAAKDAAQVSGVRTVVNNLNVAGGATWVSLHHGGGVGMGYSQHSGIVIVCDGTEAADKRIARVLWNDPGTGVMRHADAGYEIAVECAKEQGLKLPMV